MPELILVVDDEPKIVRIARDYLEKNGFRVVTAADGQSALTVARNEKPDLIVLDLMLPIMDGREVCKTLRRESDVPIIMLTALAEEVDQVTGLEIGADDSITKPFDIEELKFRLKVALRHRENILHFLSEKEQEETIPVVMEHKQRSSNHFFISYSHEDKVFAQALFAAFVRYNIPVWMDEMIGHGHKWQLVLQKKIGTCKGLILIMSENSHRSLWVQNEVAFAQSKKKKIFPLLLDGEVPLSVAAIQYIDVTNRKLPPDSFFKACYELTHKKEKK